MGQEENVPSANQCFEYAKSSKFFLVEKIKIRSSKCPELALSKKRNCSPLNVFLNKSGISNFKEFGLAGAICLIWRTRCIVLFKALEFGSCADTAADN